MYWLVVTTFVTVFLIDRVPTMRSGSASTTDAVAMGVWLALILLPLFGEVELFGMKFKAEIERVQRDGQAPRSEEIEPRNQIRHHVGSRTHSSRTARGIAYFEHSRMAGRSTAPTLPHQSQRTVSVSFRSGAT